MNGSLQTVDKNHEGVLFRVRRCGISYRSYIFSSSMIDEMTQKEVVITESTNRGTLYKFTVATPLLYSKGSKLYLNSQRAFNLVSPDMSHVATSSKDAPPYRGLRKSR